MPNIIPTDLMKNQLPAPRSIGACITAIADGDRNALAVLYEQTRVRIYGFALSITKNPADAEDVLQETCLRICETAHTYRESGKPMAWIFTITRNLALMKLRSHSHLCELEENASEPMDSGGLEAAEQKLLLQSALRLLDDQELQILMLHAVSGFRHRETADLLGLPLSTVLSKYHRSLKKLKAIL